MHSVRDEAKIIEIEMIKKQREEEWFRRKKKIEEAQSLAISTPWYMMTWSYLVGLATNIQESFRSIDILKLFYPDNPGTREIFTNVGFTLLPTILKIVSPLGLGLSWINAGRAIHRFAKAENKNIFEYSHLIFSCAAPIAWSALYIAGISLSAVALAPILPWVSVAVFGAFALHGLFNCIVNCYHAYQAHKNGNKKERNEYLKQAGKNLVGIIFNVLALTTSIILGIKMNEAAEKVKEGVEYFKKTWCFDKLNAAMTLISDVFAKGCQLLNVLTGFALGGILVSQAKNIAHMNNETWQAIRHPMRTVKEGWERLKARPIATLGNAFLGLVKLPLRIAALAFSPLQMLASAPKLFKKKTSPASAEEKTVLPKIKNIITPENLKERIEGKITNLTAAFPIIEKAPREIRAKHFMLTSFLKHPALANNEDKENKHVNAIPSLESVADIEKKAKQLSSKVYCSFFRAKGEVQTLAEELESLERNPAPAA